MMKELEKIFAIIDDEARSLVGRLLKRVEVLEKEKSLSPNLYKSLTKENIYEFSRQLKKLIKLQVEVGRVEFKQKPGEKA